MEQSPTKSPQKKILRTSSEDPIEISPEIAISKGRQIQVDNLFYTFMFKINSFLFSNGKL